jgi:hypothetical protein
VTKKELEKKTRDELLKLAKKYGVVGRHRMIKDELIEALVKVARKVKKKASAIKKAVRTEKKKAKPVAKAMVKHVVKEEIKQESAIPEHRAAQSKKMEAPEVHYIEELPELPDAYGEMTITAMPRDPHWIYTYWELPQNDIEAARKFLSSNGDYEIVLRVYDLTAWRMEQTKMPHSFEIDAKYPLGNWYINTNAPGHDFVVEVGLKDKNTGEFIFMARSNTVSTPPSEVAPLEEGVWKSLYEFGKDDFTRMLAGVPRDIDLAAYMAEKLKKTFPHEVITSPVK